jgi:hypothetical protein
MAWTASRACPVRCKRGLLACTPENTGGGHFSRARLEDGARITSGVAVSSTREEGGRSRHTTVSPPLPRRSAEERGCRLRSRPRKKMKKEAELARLLR